MGWPRSRPLSIRSYVTIGQGLQIIPGAYNTAGELSAYSSEMPSGSKVVLETIPCLPGPWVSLHILQHGMGVQGSSYCSLKPSHQ